MSNPSYYIVGALHHEYIITPDGRAHLGLLGGSALYAATGARLWSNSVGIIGRVGAGYPDAHLEKLRRCGFDLEGLQILSDPLDIRAFYGYETEERRATTNPAAHFLRIGSSLPKELVDFKREPGVGGPQEGFQPAEIRPGDIPAAVGSARGVHMAPASHLSHTSVAVRLRDLGCRRVTLDAASQYMEPGAHEMLKLVINGLDVFLVSEEHALAFFRPSPPDLWEMAETFGAMGCDYVVIKRGPRGQAVTAIENGGRWLVPAYPAKVKDVTGAGSAFSGGFLVGFCETADPLEAALRGSISASIAVEGVGALHGLDTAPGLHQARLDALRDSVKRL